MSRRLFLAALLFCSLPAPALAYDPDSVDRRPPRPAGAAPAPAIALPPGVYRVTEVYAGDVVRRMGDVTTYETNTRHLETTTYARVLEVVATGAPSRLDGLAFNGRRRLSDGRLVGGIFYQNYVLRNGRLVPWSIVFFQDDREVARHSTIAPPPATAAVPSPVRVGVDPTPGIALHAALEVARGQRYDLRVNAAIDGASLLVESWRMLAGTNDLAPEGWRPGSEPMLGRWTRMPPPGRPWTLTVEVRARSASGRTVEGVGIIEIWVRAPAIVE